MNKDDFIKNLSNELKPVSVNWKPSVRSLIWFVTSAILVLLALHMRNAFSIDLSHRIVELLVLIAVTGTLIYMSFLGVVPGAISNRKHQRGLLAINGFAAYYLIAEALHMTPAPNGVMRASCELEIIILSNIPAISLFYLLYKDRENLNPFSPFMGALACAFIPSAIMNFICSYSLKHILIYHMVPVLLFALIFQTAFVILKKVKS